MNNASLELGGTNWAEKDASLLGYAVSDDSGRFFPREFTFTRGSNLAATRIGKTGLIEKGRENLLLQSNSFSTSPWSLSGTTLTSGQTGYDGSNDAWLLTKTGASYNHLNQSISQSGVKTFSVYAKAGTLNGLRLLNLGGGNSTAYFDLSNGTLVSKATATIEAKIEAVGNGWYRCSITDNEAITQVRIYPITPPAVFSDNGSIYIQDSQFEQGLATSPYIPTTTTTAQAGVLEITPRLNYTTGVADPYLLLEPSRTNFVDSSEYAGSWSQINANITTTNNATTSPEGVDNAVKLEGLTTSSTNQIVNFGTTALNGINVVGKTYTASIYIKPVNPSDVGDDIVLSIQRNSGDFEGLNVLTEITSADWKRYDLTYTFTGAGAGNQIGANLKILRDGGTSIDDIYVYGVQLEEGTYATSYIPTYSVSATRSFDYSTIESLGYSSTCTFYYEFNTTTGREGSSPFAEVGEDDSNKFYIKGSSANNPQFQVQGNGIFSGSIGPTNEVSGINKIAVQWSSGVGIVFCNGVKQSGALANSNTSANIDFISIKGQGTSHDSKQLLFFPAVLSDAELITLTTI